MYFEVEIQGILLNTANLKLHWECISTNLAELSSHSMNSNRYRFFFFKAIKRLPLCGNYEHVLLKVFIWRKKTQTNLVSGFSSGIGFPAGLQIHLDNDLAYVFIVLLLKEYFLSDSCVSQHLDLHTQLQQKI